MDTLESLKELRKRIKALSRNFGGIILKPTFEQHKNLLIKSFARMHDSGTGVDNRLLRYKRYPYSKMYEPKKTRVIGYRPKLVDLKLTGAFRRSLFISKITSKSFNLDAPQSKKVNNLNRYYGYNNFTSLDGNDVAVNETNKNFTKLYQTAILRYLTK